jgi:hypothetical protein
VTRREREDLFWFVAYLAAGALALVAVGTVWL